MDFSAFDREYDTRRINCNRDESANANARTCAHKALRQIYKRKCSNAHKKALKSTSMFPLPCFFHLFLLRFFLIIWGTKCSYYSRTAFLSYYLRNEMLSSSRTEFLSYYLCNEMLFSSRTAFLSYYLGNEMLFFSLFLPALRFFPIICGTKKRSADFPAFRSTSKKRSADIGALFQRRRFFLSI